MNSLPTLKSALHQASAWTDGLRLFVSTGRVQRVWRWTEAGLAPDALTELSTGRRWVQSSLACAWQWPDGAEPAGAVLRAMSADVGDDEGFTSEHLRVTVEIDYPGCGMRLVMVVWAYPGANGLRTQMGARLLGLSVPPAAVVSPREATAARVDALPLDDGLCRRRLLGYHNDTQHRNDTHQHLLKEEVIVHPLRGGEWCDWASAICMEDDAGGVALVKESHKCVNSAGHDTGGFICDEHAGVVCTGWGVRPHELTPERTTFGWATWTLAYAGGAVARQHAFKAFDRVRYPIDPERDIQIQANTWGSGAGGDESRRAASEKSVLAELPICAELGIDVLQIDDGWQVPSGQTHWQPGERGWRPHPECYPNGWAPVRQRAAELGVRLGLWAAAMPISLEELQQAYAEGGFTHFKLDFADLRSRGQLDELIRKVRAFVQWTGHHVRVNWDLTENTPRFGYFFAREYGPVYLENRKPRRPPSAVYRPHTVLRDLWQIAHYLNLHRFQCTIQDVARVDPGRSDAHLHSQQYAVAAALMGLPLFFLETKLLTAEARRQVRELLAVYLQHRAAMFGGLVDPVGDCPDNASWTGFHCHEPGADSGYLMLFRERLNEQPERSIALGVPPRRRLRVTDLVSGVASPVEADTNGAMALTIDEAPAFRFLHYVAE